MRNKLSIRPLRYGLKPASRWMCVLLLTVLFSTAGLSFADVSEKNPEIGAKHTAIGRIFAEETETEPLSPGAPEIFRFDHLPITNSMITGWLAALILICVAVRFRHQVRAGRSTLFTAAVESIVVFLNGFLADIMGEKLAKKTFWLLGSFFICILCSNLLELFPGIGSIGWGHDAGHMFRVTRPLFRNVNADLNTTLALAALFFLFWFIWAWKAKGPVGILKHIFGVQGDAKGIMYVVMTVVFLAVGFLELLSIIIRPFSLAVRLYGNMFAGEVMLDTMLHKVPLMGWLLPVPFYLMEVMVGLIQAMVFTLLSAVFIMLICRHDDAEEPLEKGAEADA